MSGGGHLADVAEQQSQTEHQRRRALSEHSKSTCAALIHGRKRLRCGESVIGADRAAHRRKVGEQEEVVEERRRRCGARDRGASGRAVPPLPSSDRHPGARCAVRVCTTACPARAATAGESEGRGGRRAWRDPGEYQTVMACSSPSFPLFSPWDARPSISLKPLSSFPHPRPPSLLARPLPLCFSTLAPSSSDRVSYHA